MNEEAAFREAIHAQPSDETVRLVFADWLQDHDRDAEAALERLRVRIGRLNPPLLLEPYSITMRAEDREEHYPGVPFPHTRSRTVADLELPEDSRTPQPGEQVDLRHGDGDVMTGLRAISAPETWPPLTSDGAAYILVTVEPCDDTYPRRAELTELRAEEWKLILAVRGQDKARTRAKF